MPTYEIPLSPEAQVFTIALAGTSYKMRVYWSTPGNCWNIDLALTDGTKILSGIPLVADVDLFGPYPYLELGGSLIASTDGSLGVPPTFDNLGTLGRLFFVTPDAQ